MLLLVYFLHDLVDNDFPELLLIGQVRMKRAMLVGKPNCPGQLSFLILSWKTMYMFDYWERNALAGIHVHLN